MITTQKYALYCVNYLWEHCLLTDIYFKYLPHISKIEFYLLTNNFAYRKRNICSGKYRCSNKRAGKQTNDD